MGRRIRHFEPDGIYFITNRCAGGRFLLTPTEEANRIIRGSLARYADRWDIELFAWIFMGNHFHLIARSEDLNISEFMRDFQRDVSSEIKDETGWDLSVFPKRFDAEKILDDPMLHSKIKYTVLNPVRAGLVEHPADWPGVSSWDYHLEGEPMAGKWLDSTWLRKLERKADDGETVDPERAMCTYEIGLTNPPKMEHLSVEEAGERLLGAVDDRCRDHKDSRRLGDEDVKGAETVRNQDPTDQAGEPDEGPEPLCLTTRPSLREQYRDKFENVTDKYRREIQRWHDGCSELDFPSGTHPPSWQSPIAFEDPDDTDSSNPPPSGGDDPSGSGTDSHADAPRGDPPDGNDVA